MRELDAACKQELLKPFQAAEIRVKTVPYVAAYITARVVMTRLDETLPWQWDFEAVEHNESAGGILNVKGQLRIRPPVGEPLAFSDWGSAPPDAAKGQAKQFKHALSDSLKRSAVHVGIGRYLYELIGVQGGRVPKSGLERALAAVGYHGPWDERHHGAVGGIRESDLEDEEGDLSTSTPHEAPRQNGTAPRAANGTARTAAPAASPQHETAVDPYPLRSRFNALCHQLQQAMGHTDTEAFKARLKGSDLWPSSADDMPGIIRRLEGKLARLEVEQSSREGIPDPFDWDEHYQSAAEQGRPSEGTGVV